MKPCLIVALTCCCYLVQSAPFGMPYDNFQGAYYMPLKLSGNKKHTQSSSSSASFHQGAAKPSTSEQIQPFNLGGMQGFRRPNGEVRFIPPTQFQWKMYQG